MMFIEDLNELLVEAIIDVLDAHGMSNAVDQIENTSYFTVDNRIFITLETIPIPRRVKSDAARDISTDY